MTQKLVIMSRIEGDRCFFKSFGAIAKVLGYPDRGRETALPCPLYYSGATGIDITSTAARSDTD
jgi:hypothetical protein